MISHAADQELHQRDRSVCWLHLQLNYRISASVVASKAVKKEAFIVYRIEVTGRYRKCNQVNVLLIEYD